MSQQLFVLIDESEGNPEILGSRLNDLQEANSDGFVDEAIQYLLSNHSAWASTAVLNRIARVPRTHSILADPAACTTADAVALAGRIRPLHSGLDQGLLRALQPGSGNDECPAERALRVLEIIEQSTEGPRLQPLLARLLRHRDPRVRSKSTLISGRLVRRADWLEQRLSEPDSRVRANAVEALWGDESPTVLDLFRVAAGDKHHRVAGNAVVGLHRAGALPAVQIVQSLAAHSDPMFRASAAFAMGQTGDPRFLRLLERMAMNDKGPPRQNALRAMVRLKARLRELRGNPGLTVSVVSEDSQLRAAVRDASGGSRSDLKPTGFIVMSGGEAIDPRAVRYVSQAETYELNLPVDSAQVTAVTAVAPDGIGEWSGAE
jgi:hypothetical protein